MQRVGAVLEIEDPDKDGFSEVTSDGSGKFCFCLPVCRIW